MMLVGRKLNYAEGAVGMFTILKLIFMTFFQCYGNQLLSGNNFGIQYDVSSYMDQLLDYADW